MSKANAITRNALDAVLAQALIDLDPKYPFLVCQGIERLKQLMRWMNDIGYKKDNLVVHAFGAGSSELMWFSAEAIDVVPSKTRFGKRPVVDGSATFGIQVALSDDLPEGRDLLRVVLAWAIWNDRQFSKTPSI